MIESTGMIYQADQLRPDTSWSETLWGHSREESLFDDISRPRLCVAALLPFQGGQPDWASFEKMLRWMTACGKHFGVDITFVLNADTGYIFHLSPNFMGGNCSLQGPVPRSSFICGVTAVGICHSFDASTYHPHLGAQAYKPCDDDYDISGLNTLSPQQT